MRGLLAILFFVAVAVPREGLPANLAGPPTVFAGETLMVAGRRVRLYGIDAPDLRQTCTLRGRPYNCGRVARTALMDLVAGSSEIRCRPRDQAAGQAVRAVCFGGGYDLSAGMVHAGWAMAVPRTGTEYARIERQARDARRGLWRGGFDMPWDWRPPAD